MPTQPLSHDLSELPEKPAIPCAVERYDITHTMRFSYDAPVRLDQLVVRLQPRTDVDQHLIEFTITADPQPARQSHGIDLHGNIRHWFWFEDKHEELTITTHSVVDCFCENPFDFITVDSGVRTVPAVYGEPVNAASEHYRHRPTPTAEVDALAHQLIADADGNTREFLRKLNEYIHQNTKHIIRLQGEAWDPAVTLERGEGACRDSAVLFIDACRAAGLAARFVSGYAWDALDTSRRELHAWAEVYLPGGGWRGYDPTIGLAVANRHIPVAASPTASYAAPTSGTFTGPPVQSTLDYHIEMTQTTRPCAIPPTPATTYHWA